MSVISPAEARRAHVPHDVLVWAAFATCIAVAVVAVRVVVGGVGFVVGNFPGLITLAALAGCVAAAAFAWVRYPPEAPYLRITLAGSSVLLGLNSLWLGYDFPVVNQAAADGFAPFAVIAGYVVAAATVLSCWRPSFAMIPAAILTIQKQLVVEMTGGLAGTNHHVVLVDTIVFVSVAIIAFALAGTAARRYATEPVATSLTSTRYLVPVYLAVMCITLGVHLGNYFLSGYGKIALDGGIFSWLLFNKTQYLMLGGYNLGVAPLSFSAPLFGLAYTILDQFPVLFNALVLFAQACCFLAFWQKRLMLAWIVFFDLMHLGIFLLTGALFFHWIVLNSILLVSVARMPRDFAPRPALIAGVVATVIGHFFFHTVMLAWYDTRQVRDARFIAVFADGSEAAVPSSFFREASYTFFNRAFRLDPETSPAESAAASPSLATLEWQSPTAPWGQSDVIDVMRLGEVCGLPLGAPGATVDFDVDAAESFIRARHRWVMERLANGRPVDYHLFPHDHFSMPWFYRDFESANVREIVAYYYQVETVCLAWTDGAFERRVVSRTATQPFRVTSDDGE
jgi:hypothetical protein